MRSNVTPRIAKRIAGLPRSPREFHRSLALLGSLRDLGWQASVCEGAPIGSDGLPLPFYNYAAVFWLADRIRPADSVFEFGSGNSTLWYAKNARSVTAVEHNLLWAAKVGANLPANASLLVRQDDAYAHTIDERAEEYDIVVVDGIRRAECVTASVSHIATEGLLVLDNSDRAENYPVMDGLADVGYCRIDFVGPTPGYADITCTSMFFRPGARRWLQGGGHPPFRGGTIPGVQGGGIPPDG